MPDLREPLEPLERPEPPDPGVPGERDARRDPGEPAPRELRGLVPIEVAAVLALPVVPWPEAMPVALPLLVLATVSRWIRRRSWSQLLHGGGAGVGAAAGIVALGVAFVAGTPFVEALSARTVEWSVFPVIRGSASQAIAVGLIVVAMAAAYELALRGWIVERVLELSPGPPILPVLVGAFAEALITPGDAAVRIGAGLFGAGLGWMYVASAGSAAGAGRSLLAPIAARTAFGLGAVVLEALRVSG